MRHPARPSRKCKQEVRCWREADLSTYFRFWEAEMPAVATGMGAKPTTTRGSAGLRSRHEADVNPDLRGTPRRLASPGIFAALHSCRSPARARSGPFPFLRREAHE